MMRIKEFCVSLLGILLLSLSACNASAAIPIVTPTSSMTVQAIAISVTATSLPTEATPTEWLPYNPNYSAQGCGEFTATLPVKGTENLSQIEISQKLFEIYLAHYKSAKLGSLCKLENFKLDLVQDDKRFDFLAGEQKVDFVNTVEYSVQVKEAPTGWAAGNGELASDGWILHKYLIIGVSKVKNQYILKLIGTGP